MRRGFPTHFATAHWQRQLSLPTKIKAKGLPYHYKKINIPIFAKSLSAMTTPQPDITLYTVGTPNGQKISITLEELSLPYKVHGISFKKGEQKEPWFLKINPNGRIPAIVDHSRNNFNVFESGAIMLYLCEHYDPQGRLLPKDADARSEVIQWLMFQMGGIGPMQGQAGYFLRYAPEKIPYAIQRYQDETKRLYKVIETRLEGRKYLVGDNLTIADIATFPWIRGHAWSDISLDEFPNTTEWLKRIESREAVQRGLDVPEKTP